MPSTPPLLLSLPAMTQLAKPQSPTLPSLVTSIAAPIIPEADAGVASSSTHPSPHVVTDSPPPPCESPPNSVDKLAQNSQPLAASTSATSPPKSPHTLVAPGTESIISDPSGVFSSPQGAPIPKPPSYVNHPAPQPSRDPPEDVSKTIIMPHSPQPQQHASSSFPNVMLPAALEAGTNTSDSQPSGSAPARHGAALLFSDGEGFLEPDGEKEDGDGKSADDIVVDLSSRLHGIAKRPRAASSSPEPPVNAPRKWHRQTRWAMKKEAAKKEAVTSKPASYSPRPAPSTSRSKKNKADGSDVDMDSFGHGD
jgi:hypothetical protein